MSHDWEGQLAQQHRDLRDNFSQALTLRIHRGLSWLGRAEQETGDIDAAFIFLWVAFNAAYAQEIAVDGGDKSSFQKFFTNLVALDNEQRIYNLVWTRFSGEIRLLLDNKYIFAPFWKFMNGDSYFSDWQERMSSEKVWVNKCLASHDTVQLLSILFGRLYVLRNQIVHGGSTWNSSLNRTQINDGKALLANIIPIFLDIMMENPNHGWKMPFYTVIGE